MPSKKASGGRRWPPGGVYHVSCGVVCGFAADVPGVSQWFPQIIPVFFHGEDRGAEYLREVVGEPQATCGGLCGSMVTSFLGTHLATLEAFGCGVE